MLTQVSGLRQVNKHNIMTAPTGYSAGGAGKVRGEEGKEDRGKGRGKVRQTGVKAGRGKEGRGGGGGR